MNFTYTATLMLLITLLSFGCKIDDDALSDVYCEPFVEEDRIYFPQEPGDAIIFIREDSTGIEERRFQVASELSFADTTVSTLFENAVCDPYLDFTLIEQDETRTFLGFRITNLLNRETGGTALTINLTDSDFGGTTYVRIALIDEDENLIGGTNTEATRLDSLTLNGQLYQDVIRLSMVTPPDIINERFNDVREIWVAPGEGLIRFRDENRGVYNRE
ncbi:hypothetical protein CEQ90_12805 [Lewinellaceae bacterium SD302]|nr:hypothetical protein CEQ90_12805 [Lewinellaceae bacterium SD302]